MKKFKWISICLIIVIIINIALSTLSIQAELKTSLCRMLGMIIGFICMDCYLWEGK